MYKCWFGVWVKWLICHTIIPQRVQRVLFLLRGLATWSSTETQAATLVLAAEQAQVWPCMRMNVRAWVDKWITNHNWSGSSVWAGGLPRSLLASTCVCYFSVDWNYRIENVPCICEWFTYMIVQYNTCATCLHEAECVSSLAGYVMISKSHWNRREKKHSVCPPLSMQCIPYGRHTDAIYYAY